MNSAKTNLPNSFRFFALGLYNFARFLYGEEVENIALPDDAGVLIELHEYQKANGYATGKSEITERALEIYARK